MLYGYGENMGLAFQLRDDLLDVYGDPRTFGKRVGGDILCNKKTYLLIKALENANPMQRQELNRWLSAEEYQPEAKIEAIKQVYDELNLKAVVEKLIHRYYHASLECSRWCKCRMTANSCWPTWLRDSCTGRSRDG